MHFRCISDIVQMLFRCDLTLTVQFSLLSRVSGWVAGWVGGWSEDWRVMLNSTQDQVEFEVRVELGNKICNGLRTSILGKLVPTIPREPKPNGPRLQDRGQDQGQGFKTFFLQGPKSLLVGGVQAQSPKNIRNQGTSSLRKVLILRKNLPEKYV